MSIQDKPLVIKIGGAILEQKEKGKYTALLSLLKVIKSLKNQAIVLVHGGGCIVDEMLSQSGYTTEKKTWPSCNTKRANADYLRCFSG